MRNALFLLVLGVLAQPASAQDATVAPTAVAGTLACTMEPLPTLATPEAELSCTFSGVSGRTSTLKGFVSRQQAAVPAGKRVLVWSVLARSQGIEAEALVGQYIGPTGVGQLSRLVNKEASVVLEPMSSGSQLGDEAGLTVLALRLEAVKA